jgi:hypothetical protein
MYSAHAQYDSYFVQQLLGDNNTRVSVQSWHCLVSLGTTSLSRNPHKKKYIHSPRSELRGGKNVHICTLWITMYGHTVAANSADNATMCSVARIFSHNVLTHKRMWIEPILRRRDSSRHKIGQWQAMSAWAAPHTFAPYTQTEAFKMHTA